MPLNFDPAVRTDTITQGVAALIREGGMPAVTMRAIADVTGVSQASLAAHLGGRQHLLQVVAARFGYRLLEQMDRRSCDEGLLALLPACADDVDDLRVWLSWCDLGRTNEGVGHAVADVEDREWRLVVGLLLRDDLALGDGGSSSDAVVARARKVMTVVHGVRHLLCAPGAALTPTDARQLTRDLLAVAAA